MRKFNILDRRTGNLLFQLVFYEEKLIKPMLFKFKQIKEINISEVEENV